MRIAIFDEAHQLNETGVQFLGAALGTAQLLELARDMLGAGLQLARGLADWQELARDCEMSARDLRLVVGKQTHYSKEMRLRWTGSAPEGLHSQDWAEGLARVEEALQMAMAALDMVSDLFAVPGAGQDSVLFDFATDIDNTQTAEINIMRNMLKDKK